MGHCPLAELSKPHSGSNLVVPRSGGIGRSCRGVKRAVGPLGVRGKKIFLSVTNPLQRAAEAIVPTGDVGGDWVEILQPGGTFLND